jgi:N-acetylglucosamine-6-sulfatase
MRLAVVTILAALALAPAAAAQPNVLLIVTDDQRWDTLRYMPTVKSELVGKGVNFRNAFAVNPLCCPSRASILTGTYSHTHGVWSNAGGLGGFRAFNDHSTLPVWLSAVGYETMLLGKYLNAYDSRYTQPTYVPPGWGSWYATWSRGQVYFDYEMTDGAAVQAYGTDPADYETDVLAAQADRFIRGSTRPFFLYFAPQAPHVTSGTSSTVPAPRHVDAYAGLGALQSPSVNERDVSDKPQYVRNRPLVSEASLAQLREEQLEALLAVDDAVARMLAALEETGKLADTLIVFTSDNGHTWGEHRWTHKSDPYGESLRVPLVFRYDRLGVSARPEGRFALNVDLAPTIAATAGIHVGGREGRRLLPLLRGENPRWRSSFLFEYGRPGPPPPYCGFRSAGWKYVQYATGEEELYDLRRDPYELQSQHRAYRASVMRYRARVLRSACRPPDFRPLPQCTKTGTRRGDFIRGSDRRDWICVGRGWDRITVRRGGRDVVRCGPGFDRVRADRRDVLIGCERRSRMRIPTR